MNPVTQTLFESIPENLRFHGPSSIKALESCGISLEKIGSSYRFRYFDNHDFIVIIRSNASGDISSIILSAVMPGDEKGWNGWTKEKEMDRLSILEKWMKNHHFSEIKTGAMRLSCCFSPQDGSSSISLFNTAEQGAAANP